MTSSIPDALIAAYFRDGKWEYQPMQVVLVYFCAPPCEQPDRRRKPKRTPLPKCPSSTLLEYAIEALVTSQLKRKLLQVEEGFLIGLRNIRLSSCRVAEERFGRLDHWCTLVERTAMPNIVAYICEEKQFYVVCANNKHTQPVETRSAVCWLRDGAGLGFCCDGERGVFRIDVSRDLLNDEEDPWREGLAALLSFVPKVFEACTFDES